MLFLLDSSAVLNDFSFQFKREHKYVTTPLVFNEFIDLRSKHLAENALHCRLLCIAEPSEKAAKLIEEKIVERGFGKLSKADASLLALALDFKQQRKKFKVVTDDYSIQNFCKLLRIPFESVIRGRIKETISFTLKCPSCGKTVKRRKAKTCPVCGAILKNQKTNKSLINLK